MEPYKKKTTEEYMNFLERTSNDKKHYLSFGLRYCYGCKTKRPKGKRKAEKGWRCKKCVNLGIKGNLSQSINSKF